VKEAGTYELSAGNKVISLISFNYDRKESDLTCFVPDAIQDQIAKSNNASLHLIEPSHTDLSHTVAQLSEGKRLWKYCILLVLLFLAAEILLIRFMKS
jgi:hypothetical protein